MRDSKTGIRKGSQEGRELLQVLGRLQDPAFTLSSAKLKHLENALHVFVPGGLVMSEIPITPTLGNHQGLEEHGAAGNRQEVDFFMRMIRPHIMHSLEEGHHLVPHLNPTRSTLPAGVHLKFALLFFQRRYRLKALPPGEVANGGVRRDQVVEMGRSCSRKPHDDDGTIDLFLSDFGISLPLILHQQAGLHTVDVRLGERASQEEVLNAVYALNANSAVHGVIVQLPLPAHVDEKAVLKCILPEKDADGLGVESVAALRAHGAEEPAVVAELL